MKHSTKPMIRLLIISLILSIGSLAWAQDIKSRMRARLPEIVALKAQGAIGENNQGYLTVLKQPSDQQLSLIHISEPTRL